MLKMQYRHEVDGLRALAVLAVIFFHAGFDKFSGGFVGVDIFFVISGYLITSIILVERQNGTFSLVNFYERRLRRILPALFCVLLVSLVVAWKLLLPDGMKSFSQSLVSTSLYLSNMFFLKTSGYFDATAELKPLLHTWSLSIEEQYYLFFPVFLIFICRLKLYWALSILLIVTLLSFIAIQFLSVNSAFYLLPTRCWELLIGAFVAIYLIIKPVRFDNKVIRELAGGVGLLMLIYSIFVFDEQTPFPGPYTLVPTIGTALIILYSSSKTITGKLLSNTVLVSIGLVSYSAYLWHQPLFAFTRIQGQYNLNQVSYLALIALTFLLAYISWKYIETPFRSKQNFSRQQIFVYSAVGSIGFIVFGLIGSASNGYSNIRFSDNELKKLSSYKRSNLNICNFEDCKLSEANKDDWILIGDSNAYHFSVIFNEVINKKGKRLYNLARGGCLPVVGIERKDQLPTFNVDCNEHYSKVRNYALNKDSPKNILISAAWGFYLYGNNYPQTDGFEKFYNTQVYPVDIKNINKKDRVQYVLNAIKEELGEYSKTGKNIFLIYPMPFLQSEIPQNRSRINWDLAYDYQLFKNRNKELLDIFRDIEALPNITVFKPDTVICPEMHNRVCVSALEDKSLYSDRTHLSDFGARKVFTTFFETNVK
jgi:peptidoglycan/LPS O-acetylase OafA/YrhL